MAEKGAAAEEEVVPEEAETFEEAWDEEPEEVGGEEEAPTDETGEPKEEAEEPKSDEPEKKEELSEEPAEGEPAAKDDAPAAEGEVKLSYEDLEKQLKESDHKYSTLQGMYNKEVSTKTPPPEKEEEPEAEEAPESFMLDTAAIAEGIEKLPGVMAAVEEHGEEMGAALKEATGLIVKEFNGILANFTERVEGRFGKISETVEPIQADHVKSKDEAHFSAIKVKHPDFTEYVESGELRAWVDTHTGVKKEVFDNVMKHGSTSEAIDLVGEFREAKGYEEKPEEAPEAKEEIDEAKQKKLEAMEAVDVKKSPVSLGKGKGGKDDFENSWDDF